MRHDTIPTEHLIDPRVGYVGFRGAASLEPPRSWHDQHRLGELGGYFRTGRRWTTMSADSAIPVPCIPVSLLYRPLFARVGGAAGYAMGWCVDA